VEPFEAFTVRYTRLQRFAIPLGTLMFGALGTCLVIESGAFLGSLILLATVSLVLGVWFLLLAHLGLKLSRDLFLEVVVDRRGITVKRRSESHQHSWEEIVSHRFDQFHRVLWVFDSQGNDIFMIDADAPGCTQLRRVLRHARSAQESLHA
jgi:hypothetical protein